MLIQVDFDDTQFAQLDIELLAEALSELLRAHRRGHHLAVLSRRCATWITENVPLSQSDLALVTRLGQDYTQTGRLSREAEVFVRLVSERSAVVADTNRIDVTLRDFISSNLSDIPLLLLEDAPNDGAIYRIILELIRKRRRYTSLTFRPSHGGGTGTIRQLEQLIEEKRVVVVILDSDRKTPLHPIPPKVRSHELVFENANWAHGTVVCLPCREIENLVPLAALRTLACATGRAGTLNWLDDHQRSEENNSVPIFERTGMFFDIKEGLDPEEVREMRLQGASEWWTRRTGDQLITGFGQNVLTQIISTGRSASIFREEILKNGVLEFLEAIFSRLIWFLVASSPLRA